MGRTSPGSPVEAAGAANREAKTDAFEPAVVQVDQWRPDDGPGPVLPPEGRTDPLHVGVGRKP